MSVRFRFLISVILPLTALALAGCAQAEGTAAPDGVPALTGMAASTSTPAPTVGTPRVATATVNPGWSAGRGETPPIAATQDPLPFETQVPESRSAPGFAFVPDLRAKKVDSGYRHTCAITDSRSIRCWGDNADGQLGDGTIIQKSTPADVLGLDGSIVDVSAGYNHTCAVISDGRVWCWGNNAFGQLGDGSQTSRTAPVEVPLAYPALAISAGSNHSCAATENLVYCWGIVDYKKLAGEDGFYFSLKPYPIATDMDYRGKGRTVDSGFDFDCKNTSGRVDCWGRNDHGQLGIGLISYSRTKPWDVAISRGTAEKFSVGGMHACAIINVYGSGRSVRCWGYNNAGQLGSRLPRESAVPLEVPGLSTATEISAGANHTCVVTGDGRVRCWGDNRFGQLGGEAPASENGIVEVIGLTEKAASVAAGGSHTCAVLKDGAVACWGNNRNGQLGGGSATRIAFPTETPESESSTPASTPDADSHAATVAAGRSHTCAVTGSGAIQCWGKNEHGQLGNGSSKDSLVPVTVSGLTGGMKEVVAGWGHTCALSASGGVKCWGYNKNGELGDGTNLDSNSPVQVRGLGSGVISLETGDDHTCAILAAGAVKCWGYNLYGQLGDGTVVDGNIPVAVAGINVPIAALAAGWGHTCALSTSGGVKCWGNNSQGQTGSGSGIENFHEPVWVAGLSSGVTAISADGGQTCALTARKVVLCWGNNKYGQLGDGTAEARSIPVVVEGLRFTPVLIASGWNHTCALSESGEMACWGWNFYGQLGNGIRTSSMLPVDAGELIHRVKQMSLGWGHMCAITAAGATQCWGSNEFGQVGDGTVEDAYLPMDVIGLAG